MLAANNNNGEGTAALNSGGEAGETATKSCSLDNIFDTTDIAFADDEDDDFDDGGRNFENAGNYSDDVTDYYSGQVKSAGNNITNKHGGGGQEKTAGNCQNARNAPNYRNVAGEKALIAATTRATDGQENKDDLTPNEMISKDTSEINKDGAKNTLSEKREKECGGVTSITPDIVKPVKSCPVNSHGASPQGRF